MVGAPGQPWAPGRNLEIPTNRAARTIGGIRQEKIGLGNLSSIPALPQMQPDKNPGKLKGSTKKKPKDPKRKLKRAPERAPEPEPEDGPEREAADDGIDGDADAQDVAPPREKKRKKKRPPAADSATSDADATAVPTADAPETNADADAVAASASTPSHTDAADADAVGAGKETVKKRSTPHVHRNLDQKLQKAEFNAFNRDVEQRHETATESALRRQLEEYEERERELQAKVNRLTQVARTLEWKGGEAVADLVQGSLSENIVQYATTHNDGFLNCIFALMPSYWRFACEADTDDVVACDDRLMWTRSVPKILRIFTDTLLRDTRQAFADWKPTMPIHPYADDDEDSVGSCNDDDGKSQDPRKVERLQEYKEGNDAVVNALLAAGANVHRTNGGGQTMLMVAMISKWQSPAVVKALLKAGADANAVDDYGCTALKIAMRSDYQENVDLIQDAVRAAHTRRLP